MSLQRLLRYVRNAGLVVTKRLRYRLAAPIPPRATLGDIPFVAQFASPQLVKDFVTGQRDVKTDPRWRQSGASTRDEYAIWAWNGCGMACLAMILERRTGKKHPFAALGKRALKYGCYRVNAAAKRVHDDRNYYDGLFYAPFLKFIRAEFGWRGKSVSPLLIDDILHAIAAGNFVIASVHPHIRTPAKLPTPPRGHLVLITGYDLPKQQLFIHNPSGYFGQSQQNFPITFRDFQRFFAGRGIIIFNG